MARNKVIKRRRKNTIRRNIDAICCVCGSAYIAHRATSKYCSDACKQFAYEEKKRGRAAEPKKATKNNKKNTEKVVEKKPKPTPEQRARIKESTSKLLAMRESEEKPTPPQEALTTALAKIEGNEVRELPFARMWTKKHWENDWYYCLVHLLKSCNLDHIINSLPKSWDWNKTFVKGGNVYRNDFIVVEVVREPDRVDDFRRFVKKRKRLGGYEEVGNEYYKVSLKGTKDMCIDVDEEKLLSNKNIYAYQLWGEEKGYL